MKPRTEIQTLVPHPIIFNDHPPLYRWLCHTCQLWGPAMADDTKVQIQLRDHMELHHPGEPC